MNGNQLTRLWCIGLAMVSLAQRPAEAEFTCSVKLEGTAQAGVERSGMVSWKNDGPALAAPLVRISAGDGVVVRLTANDVWASSIEFLATSSGLPPSQLHARESGSLPFLFRSTTTDGKLELSYTTASAEPFPWTEIADSLKPSSVTDEVWSFALKTLKARFGTTWDSYLARFRADVDLFARNGCFERRMDRLMQYELARALGTDSVIPALSEAQDAARSARGLGLVLTRTYPSSVSARFASGMFGYGWTDNLSTVAELTDAKTLVFRTPGGASCTFTKTSGSWQSEDVRDRTRLTETSSAYVLAYQSGTVQTFAKANMRTASIADSSGNQLTFTWNGAQLAKIAHTDGQSLTFASANGLLSSVTDDSGRQTTYAYSNGLLTAVTSFDGLTTRYEYRPADGSVTARALSRIVYPDGTTREFAYGEDGLVASLSVDGGKEKATIVRREGEVAITDTDGSTTVMKTGLTGEAYETKDALGGTSVSRYGADGLLKAVVTPSDLTSTLKHDALGRVVETTSAGESTTSFAYEETFGNLRSVTDAKGHAVTYGYDEKGRGTSVTFPDNSSSRVEYNSRGDVVKTCNRRGESVAYAYDARGRLTRKIWSNGRTFTYAYDARGNVTEASDSETGTVKMEYDAAERMTKIEYPGGRGFTFVYDAYGRLTRRSSFDGSAECFAYDVRGRLASVTDGEGNPYLRNVYDETTGRLVRQENGNGTSTTYLYDKLGRTTSIEHLNADGKIVEALEYCYDVDGRCIRASSVFGEERFGYDADGQVTQAVYPDAPAETFAYDAVGNRTTANAANYTVNALNQYTAVSASSSTSSATFTYDADGNLTSMTDADGTTTYGYDTLNRLVTVKNASAGLDWSCKYDALGNRVSVTENGVTTERVYLQGALPSVAAEYVNGELKSRHILVGAVRIADISGEAASSPLEQKGAVRYLHADLIGSVRLVTDADGYTQSRATYRAFGELRGGWDMDGIDGYVGTLGVETDSTGLLFMRNRYYSPALGRFIQADPIGHSGGDENWYRYCRNEPGRFIDPTGTFFDALYEGYCEPLWNRNGATARNSGDLPATMGEARNRMWDLLGSAASQYHGAGRYKMTAPNGQDEAVYKEDGTLDLSPEYMGTYNVGTHWWTHFLQDMFPYWVCGNTASDTTPWYNRILNPYVWGYNHGRNKAIEEGLLIPPKGFYQECSINDPFPSGGDTPPGGGTGGGQITSEADWLKISTNKNASTATYSLGADVTLTKRKCIVYGFSGTLAGNGHTIKLSGELADGALFSSPDGAIFNGVAFGRQRLATRYENCHFENCTANYSGEGRGAYADVAIGCDFKNCKATASVSPTGKTFGQGIGGLVGSATSCEFDRCSTSGSVSGDTYVGGFVGKAYSSTFSNCRSDCAVQGQRQVGGFIGLVNSSITEGRDLFNNCKATGTVRAGGWAGGFAGDVAHSTIRNCTATGTVTEDLSLGDAVAEQCYFGGFVGHVSEGSSSGSEITACLATGGVTAPNSDDIGGFVGLLDGTSSIRPTVSQCMCTGAVVGRNGVGGFAGKTTDCDLVDCAATSPVTASGDKYGLSLQAAAFSSGGTSFVMTCCFASGKVTVSGSPLMVYTGGLVPVAKGIGTGTNCYWDMDSTGQKTSAVGTGLSSSKAKNPSSFSGWNFTGLWQMVDGHPTIPGAGATGGADDDPSGGGASDPAEAVDVAGDPASGSVSGTGTYEAGETVKLTAMPTADCLFDGWYADAACTMLVSSESAWSFVVEDPAQRYFAKFSTKASKLEATRVYCYDRYVVHKGMPCWFQIDGFAPIGTSLAVSGLPAGFTFDVESMMVCGTAMRTGSYVMTMTTASAAGTKTRKIPFVVIDADGGPDDAPCAEFAETTAAAAEGGVVRVTVYGGGSGGKSSALLYFTPGSADAKDVDLANVTVDGVKVPKAKFPLALSWGADDDAVKTIEIPVKTDKTVEGEEFFLLQLGGADGQDLGENRTCRVAIVDETVSVPLAQAANVPLLKVTTKGDGKWIAAKGNVFHFPDAERGMYHVRSPELKPGQSSTLEFAGIKGMGVLKVYYRFIGEYDGGAPATLRILENREPLEPDTPLSHAESGTGKHYFTVDERNDGAHTYSCVFTQGDNPDVRMEIVSVQWTPASGANPVTICVSSNGSGFGTVTGSGTYQVGETVKLTAKPAAGRTFAGWYKGSASTGGYELYDATHASLTIKATETMDIMAFFLDIPYVLGLADSADRGKVTGSGFCAEGKKVTLKATANKGYVFMGWYRGDGTPVAKTASIVIDRSTKPAKDSASSTTITGITSDVTYYAVYVTAEEDAASIGATVNGFAFGAGTEDSDGGTVTKMATNVTAGVYLEWPVAASALSATTVKVAGLPGGLKFTAKPVTSKVGSGKTTVTVTNVAANTIYGAPSKASKSDKYGNVTPSKVKVTVTTAGKNKQVYQIDTTVDPLPAWAVGTFAGPSYGAAVEDGGSTEACVTNGQATVSVAASGKITAKQPVNGRATSFAAKYFDACDGESFWATLTAKVGKEVVTNEMVVSGHAGRVTLPDGSEATVTNGVIVADLFDAWQYNWKTEPWKAIGKSFDKREVTYEEDGVKVTLKFSANGTAKVAGEFATYDQDGNVVVKNGKPVTVKASGSATLLPVVGEDGETRYLVFVYLAPKGLATHARCLEVR